MSNDINSVMINDRPSAVPVRSGERNQVARRDDKVAQNLQSSPRQSSADVPAEDIEQLVDLVNKTLKTQSTAVRFKVDKQDGELVTSIYNTDTHEVIREIPSQELREISARLKEYQNATEQAGLLVDQIV